MEVQATDGRDFLALMSPTLFTNKLKLNNEADSEDVDSDLKSHELSIVDEKGESIIDEDAAIELGKAERSSSNSSAGEVVEVEVKRLRLEEGGEEGKIQDGNAHPDKDGSVAAAAGTEIVDVGNGDDAGAGANEDEVFECEFACGAEGDEVYYPFFNIRKLFHVE